MLSGKNSIIISLPGDDANKKINVGRAKIEIKNLIQDQYAYEPVVATLIAFDPELISKIYQTETRLSVGMQIIVDHRAGMDGELIELKEDGTRILAALPTTIHAFIGEDGSVRAFGPTVICRPYDQDQDAKNSIGLYVRTPLPHQVWSVCLNVDDGYHDKLRFVEPGRVLIHYPDTDIVLNTGTESVTAIRFRDILGYRGKENQLEPVSDSVVMKPTQLQSRFLIVPEEVSQIGFSEVVSSGIDGINHGDVLLHNRGELVLKTVYDDQNILLSKKDFIYARLN